MSTRNKSATAGAGPCAAISAEPGRQVACRPPDMSAPSAAWTLTGSGPNSAAYCSDVTVWPEAISLASRSGERALRPRRRSTWVVVPARPRCVACAIAVDSSGVGELRLSPADARWTACDELQAAVKKIARAASAPSPRIRSVWRFRSVPRRFPDLQLERQLEPELAVRVGRPGVIPGVDVKRGGTGARPAEPAQQLGHEPGRQSLAAMLRDGADRAHDAYRLRSGISGVGLDLAQGERGPRPRSSDRHQGQVGRACGRQLSLMAR